MKRPRIIDKILNEKGYCGSDIIVARLEVLKEMIKENQAPKIIDYFVFGPGFHTLKH